MFDGQRVVGLGSQQDSYRSLGHTRFHVERLPAPSTMHFSTPAYRQPCSIRSEDCVDWTRDGFRITVCCESLCKRSCGKANRQYIVARLVRCLMVGKGVLLQKPEISLFSFFVFIEEEKYVLSSEDRSEWSSLVLLDIGTLVYVGR